jgi:RNA recognition motif. (a.k.a. RRM, RBD, or RNP domain)
VQLTVTGVRSVRGFATPGFGFVEMDNGDEAQVAITALNGHEANGRTSGPLGRKYPSRVRWDSGAV